MFKNISLSLSLIICSFISQLAMANSNQQVNNIWQVSQVEGTAQTRSTEDLTGGSDWRNLSVGENLTGPAYLRTSPDSRIILNHRNDRITIASSTLLKLEKETYTETGILTKIVQTVGYALFNIEKNSGRRNEVETPYLVSVVKGTTFSVQVSPNGATVNLIEGRLQVKAAQFNGSTIINQGEVAQLRKNDKKINVYSAHEVLNQQQLNHNNTFNTTQTVNSKLDTTTDTINNTITTVNSVTSVTGVSGLVGIPVVTNVTGTPIPPVSSIVTDTKTGALVITDTIGNVVVPDITGSVTVPIVTDAIGSVTVPDLTAPVTVPDVTAPVTVPTVPTVIDTPVIPTLP